MPRPRVQLCGYLDLLCGFRIEADGLHGRPVAGLAGPSLWMALFGLGVDMLPDLEHFDMAASVSIVGRDEVDGAVQMLGVVPADEARGPGSSFFERSEGPGWKVGPVLGRAES